MKPPLILTFLILAAGAFWGVREQQALASLLEKQREINRKAEALGVSTDASKPAPTKITRRQSEDSKLKVKAFADTCVAFAKDAKELEKSGKQPDLKRHLEMLDGMHSLNGEELKLLLAELRDRTDIDDNMRKEMCESTINALALRDPQAALAIFADSSVLLGDPYESHHALTTALSEWAKDQPLAAVEWTRQHADQYPQLGNDDTKAGIVTGVAQKDFGLAFQLADELKLSVGSDQIITMAGMTETPERQAEFIAALRKQASLMTDKDKAEELLYSGTISMFSRIAETGYEKTMAWLAASGLTDEESAGFSASIHYKATKADTGRWLDWISSQPDAKRSEGATRSLVLEWTENDYKAAGEWLTNAPAGPMKENATLAYLETIAPYDSATATQWAETLTGDKRTDAMKRIHHMLQQKDKTAASDFANRHGLAEE